MLLKIKFYYKNNKIIKHNTDVGNAINNTYYIYHIATEIFMDTNKCQSLFQVRIRLLPIFRLFT